MLIFPDHTWQQTVNGFDPAAIIGMEKRRKRSLHGNNGQIEINLDRWESRGGGGEGRIGRYLYPRGNGMSQKTWREGDMHISGAR